MTSSDISLQSLHDAFKGHGRPLRCVDPRASREAAWEAIERGYISPDPSFGASLDEFDFPERCGGMVGRLPTPARSGS